MTIRPVAIKPTSHVCWGVVEENLLLFNMGDRRLHVLNNTAAMVWAMADGTTTIDSLIELLSAEYQMTTTEIEDDVREVTARLIESGLCCYIDDDDDAWTPLSMPSPEGVELPDFTEDGNIGPYNAMGVAVGISVADRVLRTELERVLAPLADPSMDTATANGRLVYHIDVDELGFNLRANDDYLARGTTRPLALRALLTDMNSGAIGSIDDALVLHAAAAEIRGSIIVMPGVSNSGKSTLVAQLCERGASYLTDEAVAVGHDGIAVRPFAKSICVERGSQQKLASLLPAGESPARGAIWDIDPREIGPGLISTGGNINGLVFPIYRPHTPTPVFRKMARIETMHRLLANSFDFSAVGQPAFAVLIRLANLVDAYELAHGGQNHLGLVEGLARDQAAA